MSNPAPALADVSLTDTFDLSKRDIYITGTQALVRLLLIQKERDRRAGIESAGFVSGYRGSPLGNLDSQLTRAKSLLDPLNIRFQPGLNEDLAATAVWGSQQATIRGEGAVDGVFGLWYGKGPGVDRTGDVLRHANLAGSHRNGGVLALMGDDHTAESSTTAHQSEYAFYDAMIPILSPSGVQEILDFGILGWALSRYAGCWVGLKCVKDNVESTVRVNGSVDRVSVIFPDGPDLPEDGLNIRTPDTILAQEKRLHTAKIPAMLRFIAANDINRLIWSGGPDPRIGIVTSGKSYLDVIQALENLGISETHARDLGLSLYKVGVPWPLEPKGISAFSRGLELLIVVEEKRGLIETQIREQLFGQPDNPVIIGKRDETGAPLFPSHGALDANEIAIALGQRIMRGGKQAEIKARVKDLEDAQVGLHHTQELSNRVPYFCAGCPHNTSTRVPDGSRAYAGIGCSYMVQWMDRATEGYTQMGGEGANWVGEAPFSTRDHVFQNLGDGTFNHSGSLALRFAAGTGVNITYKVLFNDAVAMTGGQAHEGGLSVPRIAAMVAAEGARRIAIVTDEPDKYPVATKWPEGVTIHHRDQLMDVQRDMVSVKGVSVLIYDQTCAAEKRRRRKKGTYPDPDRRILINARVCEGCGDCSVASNCVALQPLETEYGRKRQIDQSACNKDFSCLGGFCPSFVSVSGAPLSKNNAAKTLPDIDALSDPDLPVIDGTWKCMVTGIGGTGVITIGAILGMAAHLEGKGLGIIDMTGLAQKGGAVFSHIRVANKQADISAIRIDARAADLILGGDIAVVGSAKVLAAARPDHTEFIVNATESFSGEFTQNPDFTLPSSRIRKAVEKIAGEGNSTFIDAQKLMVNLLGNSIAANMFLVGLAYQRGRIPLSGAAIRQAIRLNAQAVEMNLAAFDLGRLACVSPQKLLLAEGKSQQVKSLSVDDLITRRAAELSRYQNRAYGDCFIAVINKVRQAEHKIKPGSSELTRRALESLFKVMAYKDEYEVARLYTDGSFAAQLEQSFGQSRPKLRFHMAPPLLARKDPSTGLPRKMSFGPWILNVMRLLAALKFLRTTPLDPFGRTSERRLERRVINDFTAMLEEVVDHLSPDNFDLAMQIATLPESVRGFGHVKLKALARFETEKNRLVTEFHHATRSATSRDEIGERA